jgi:hypothetical protein
VRSLSDDGTTVKVGVSIVDEGVDKYFTINCGKMDSGDDECKIIRYFNEAQVSGFRRRQLSAHGPRDITELSDAFAPQWVYDEQGRRLASQVLHKLMIKTSPPVPWFACLTCHILGLQRWYGQ